MEKYRQLHIKLTPQRLAILRYLEGNREHPSAERIYKSVQKEFPTMSFATVYNTLEALKNIGNIQELKAGKTDDAFSISENIKENEEKIIYHGRRADAIVKNMLLHSRGGSGIKEPTDINAMADEYLRLSFHGMRAREKSFNAKYETSFDNAIGKINIVQQEIGRVLLNLINNAFYAVNEKAKQNIAGYDPIVTVSTKKLNGKVEIRVADNGNGIPGSIKEKIFQPFFTTKPTGQGTGLGLSLSYDIVTKGHGGTIEVVSHPGEGTAFTIIILSKG